MRGPEAAALASQRRTGPGWSQAEAVTGIAQRPALGTVLDTAFELHHERG